MDFLDPAYERRSRIKLLLGYGLVTLAIAVATLVMLYWSYGYSIDRQGDVTQNGLLFVASQPSGAAVYLNGQRYKSNTNTRMVTPAGRYTLSVSKTGYRTWERPVMVAGGDVQHFDYPFLFPQKLATTSLADLTADPSIATQSPDKRWLLLGRPDASGTFTEYDLKNPAKPVVSDVVLPDGSFTPGTGNQSWTPVEWANDNQHVLLNHTYVAATGVSHEYILLNRDTPSDSVNLTNTLHLAQTETPSLFNNRVEQFYIYDTANLSLRRVNGKDGSEVSRLEHVLAFKTYADDKILYVTDRSPTGKTTPNEVSAVLQAGQQTTTLRVLPPAGNGTYVLNLAQYAGNWYVAVASTSDTDVYVYKNPQTQTSLGADGYPAPWRRLSIDNPNFLSFSSSTQFLLAENGQDFVVYDFENMTQYRYHAAEPIDAPQTHAAWMDGDRLLYVSNGTLEVFDYDYRNRQSLVPANSIYTPFFSGDFSYLYALRAANAADAKPAITSTPLVVK